MDFYLGDRIGRSFRDYMDTSDGSWAGSFTSWPESSSSPSPNAFIDPDFGTNNAPAFPSAGVEPFNSNASLLHYARSRFADAPPPSSSAHQLLQLRLGPASSYAPPSAIENQAARTRYPAAAIFNPSMMEEDVLVMDGVPVRPSGAGRRRSQSLSDLASSSSSSLSSVNIFHGGIAYKTELCTAWEHQWLCRHGSKCQFAHGKEELQPTRPTRRQNGAGQRRGRTAATQRSDVDGSREHHLPDVTPATDPAAAAVEQGAAAYPAEEAHINSVLYVPSQRRRLPVFFDLAPTPTTQ